MWCIQPTISPRQQQWWWQQLEQMEQHNQQLSFALGCVSKTNRPGRGIGEDVPQLGIAIFQLVLLSLAEQQQLLQLLHISHHWQWRQQEEFWISNFGATNTKLKATVLPETALAYLILVVL
jgi:hypothetical protein